MNIKKSIEWLNLKRKCDDRVFQDSIIERHQKIDDVIKHLQILEEIEEMFTPGKIFYICKNKNFEHHAQQIMDLKYIIDELKQKYFPSPVKKYITIEVESEKESEVDAGMEDIKELVDNMGCPKMKIANSWVEVDKK